MGERWQWPRYADRIRDLDVYRSLCAGPVSLRQVPIAAAAWIFEEVAREIDAPLLVVVPKESEALAWIEAARLFSGREDEIFEFPAPPLTPYQETETALSFRAREAVALDRLAEVDRATLVCTPRALWHPVPGRGRAAKALTVRQGEDVDLSSLQESLAELGYRRAEMVDEVGSFALRGGILDVYSPGMEDPVRLDFFGDEIESIRPFDATSQRSLESPEGGMPAARLRPMSQLAADPETAMQLGEVLEGFLPGAATTEAKERVEGLRSGTGFPGWEHYLPLLMPERSGIAGLLGPQMRVVSVEPQTLRAEIEQHRDLLTLEHHTRLEQGRIAVPPELLTVPPDEVEALLDGAMYRVRDLEASDTLAIQESDSFVGQLPRFPKEVEVATERGEDVVVVGAEAHQERLGELLHNRGISSNRSEGGAPLRVQIVEGELTRGFRWPGLGLQVYSEGQLVATRRARKTRKRGASAFLSSLRDLKVGEYVVHEDHGIGRFLGMRDLGPTVDSTVSTDIPATLGSPDQAGSAVEVMEIEYKSGRTLLLPLQRIDQIQRYSGIDGLAPKLDQLGGASWNKKKSRLRKGLKQLATDLLKLYAQRSLAKAPVIESGTDMQRQFETNFEFEETPDQLDAIDAISKDMASGKPMDRLLVGDVGFGKTEVAMRAAFKAVDAGYQVAVLAPTTILADQHLQTFRERYEGFPISIDMVSRLRSSAEVKEVKQQLTDGKIDVLIGTHRLLSKDIRMPNLALLIIDEEQRFGVAQKERLTEMRKNVHVLALSATPVPRTLQLSLAGVRDLSTIESPPKDRMAVETRVVPFDAQLIREAIDFELERDGQVFYVYNRVEDIERVAQMLRELVPGIRITVGHGQLDEKEMAARMRAFKAREHDLLLATTIIENGIDIPNVNTMLVHRADNFGLGQLYQLRGRVGRSDQLGFCYLMVPGDRVLKQDARKRLQTIEEFSELGAGFRVAGRDLEIRGAGNLLGAEQSGHISDVGIETYLRMLEQTIKELRGEVVEELPSASIDLPLDMTIPTTYVRDDNLRMEVYSRLASADEIGEALIEELEDRFGPVPGSVRVLAEAARLKQQAEKLRIQSISAQGDVLSFRLRRDARVDVERLIQLVSERGDSAFTPSGVLRLERVPADDWLQVSFQVLETIGMQTSEGPATESAPEAVN